MDDENYCDGLDRLVGDALADGLETRKMLHKIRILVNMYQGHEDWGKVECLEIQRKRILRFLKRK